MAYAPARPGTGIAHDGEITGAIIRANGADAGSTGLFFLKTTQAQVVGSTPVVETTGAGDGLVMYNHGDKPYYDITLQGVMLGIKGVGLQYLTQQIGATNDATNVLLSFKFSNKTEHAWTNMPCIITQCQIQFDPKLPVVGVALALKSMVGANKGLSGSSWT
jgi:hypothetical protein